MRRKNLGVDDRVIFMEEIDRAVLTRVEGVEVLCRRRDDGQFVEN